MRSGGERRPLRWNGSYKACWNLLSLRSGGKPGGSAGPCRNFDSSQSGLKSKPGGTPWVARPNWPSPRGKPGGNPKPGPGNPGGSPGGKPGSGKSGGSRCNPPSSGGKPSPGKPGKGVLALNTIFNALLNSDGPAEN